MSESHRAARSFSLVKVNGRFFNLIERDTQRGGERGKVRKKKNQRCFITHALYSPQSI